MSTLPPSAPQTLMHQRVAMACWIVLCSLFLWLPDLALAQVSGGLQRSVTVMEQIREWAWLIIPIVCLLSGGVAGVLYSMDVIRKDTLYIWIGGTVFAGLIAAGVVELVF